MYEAHRRRPRPDSTDWAILSPAVPVFRTDDGSSLPEPWPSAVITCATPYAPALERPFAGAFDHAVFAIADTAPDRSFRGPVQDVFAAET